MPPNPPPVIVTTDLDGPQPPPEAGTPATPQRHRRSPTQASDPTHLSPGDPAVTGTPASALTPPSPTLTANSSSPTSDGLEPINENGHQRTLSSGAWSANTEKPSVYSKDMISPTTTKLEDEVVDEKRGKKGKKNKPPPPMSHLDPEKDTTDPTPYAEKPSRLAMLVDPKSLEDLEKIGGVSGVLNGLGVDPNVGLCTDGSNAGAPRSSSDMPGQGAQWRTSLEDRRRVYGPNDLPHRPSKTLLQLMWIAFKDKVIVSTSV
jgi:Ca2+-transporting ATPase